MRTITRTLSFFTTWTAEFVGHPALILSLIIGPFLVLFLFGQGVDVTRINPEVIVVESENGDAEMQPLPEELDEHVTIVDQTTDLAGAVERLQDGEVDGVAVLPQDPEGQVESGEHVPIQVFINDIDPVRRNFTESYLADQVSQLNQQTIASAIETAQESSVELTEYVGEARGYVELARTARGDVEEVREQIEELNEIADPLLQATDAVVSATEGVSFVLPGLGIPDDELQRIDETANTIATRLERLEEQLASDDDGVQIPSDEELASIDESLAELDETTGRLEGIPPEVLSAPFELQLENVAPFREGFGGFYAPAVLALLIQHTAISLAALSMTRIRLLGLMRMLKVAPVRASEVVHGNYLAYGLVIIVIAGLLLVAMTTLLPVPIYGEYWQVAAVVVALTFVSLGAGFVISLISSTEQQAAQLAMLILLASVFFSGIVIALERITWPIQLVSYILPATYGTRALQDVMLRGVLRHPEDLIILAVAGVVLYALTIALLRREFRPR